MPQPLDDSKKQYSISQLACEFGVTARTIRYYEELGLLNSLRNSATQQRYYTARDKARLKLILRGKRFNLSLSEIKEIIDLYDVDPSHEEQLRKAIELGERRLEEMEETIVELKQLKEDLSDFVIHFKKVLKAKK